MNQFSLYPLLSVFLLLAIMSCGEGNHKKQDLTPREIDIKCEIQGENLENFLEKEVPQDISCLGRKLKLFTKIVEPDSSHYEGFLSLESLERYIRLDPELGALIPNLKFLELFFDITNLIFGDFQKPGYLRMSRIDEMTSFLILANKHLVIMKSLLKKKKRLYDEVYSVDEKRIIYQKYFEDRKIFLEHSELLKTEIVKLFKKGRLSYNFQFSLEKLIQLIHDPKDSEEKGFLKYKKLLFVKRLFLGGNPSVISQTQLFDLVEKSTDTLATIYDVIHLQEIVFPDNLDKLKYYLSLVNRIEALFYYKSDRNIFLFDLDQLKEALKCLQKQDGFEFDKYFELIPELKNVFMYPNDSRFRMRDFLDLFDKARKILQTGIDFTQFYRENFVLLERTTRVDKTELATPLYQSANFERFAKVINNYRYFKGKEKMPSFGNEYRRTDAGVAEIGMLEVIFEIIAAHYEKELPCTDDRLKKMKRPNDKEENMSCNVEDHAQTLTQGQLEYIVYKLKKPLFELDLVTPKREFGTAENGMLMTDLFQFQSDSDVTIDTSEGVEFGLQLVAAVGMRDEIMLAIDSVCQDESIKNPTTKLTAYKVECVRRNFFDVLGFSYTKYFDPVENKLLVKPNYVLKPGEKLIKKFTFYDFMPRFYDYQMKLTPDEKKLFIHKMELFTRTCAVYDDQIPYERPDLVTIFGAIFNIEAAIARFDLNNDNILLEQEVDEAYKHYRAGLKAIKDIPDAFIRPAFYLLIKKMKSPTTFQVLWNKVIGRYEKNAFIDQTTVAAVLAEIKISSPSALTPEEKNEFCINILPQEQQ